MSAPPHPHPTAAALAREEETSAEQILASALALYAALPPAVRSATIEALRSSDPTAHATLVHELVRTVVMYELRQRREAIRERTGVGELPALPDLSDEEMGAEAVRLVKESRRRRTGSGG
ncbi:MAG TPA: hypothetical protein VFX98_03225 [Longimicrobiaceae bacterium]|nr:hypothetical protein [Longimicrobiaceae bacterium]